MERPKYKEFDIVHDYAAWYKWRQEYTKSLEEYCNKLEALLKEIYLDPKTKFSDEMIGKMEDMGIVD